MYVGHVGAALGGKRLAPSVALATLVVVTYLPDWADAGLCIIGRYHRIQIFSHSIPAVIVLAALAASTQLAGGTRRAALVLAGIVVSHLLLDYLTGIKPTWPGGPIIGLGIYRYPLLDFVAEAVVIVAGWMFYRQSIPRTESALRLSSVMLALLLLMQLGVDAGRMLFPVINKC